MKRIMLLKVVYTHYSQSVFFFFFRSMAKVLKDKVTQYVLLSTKSRFCQSVFDDLCELGFFVGKMGVLIFHEPSI